MPFAHVIKLFIDPAGAWADIHTRGYSVSRTLLTHTAFFALLPAVAGFWGTTRVGWQIGSGGVVRLTEASAGPIALAYYFAMIVGALSVAAVIRWMSETYGARQPFAECFALATYSATPLFLVGLAHFNPIIWLNFVLGIPALGFTVYLFYTGVPVMMDISRERAFLFASAALLFGMVALVATLATMVILWGAGFAPAFSN